MSDQNIIPPLLQNLWTKFYGERIKRIGKIYTATEKVQINFCIL